MIKQFADESIRRIVRSVLWTERRSLTRFHPEKSRLAQSFIPRTALASEDIDHRAIGKVKLASASDWDGSPLVPADREMDVINLRPKIWSGSRCVVEPYVLQGAGSQLAVREAWSATKIEGTTSAPIAPGTSGLITSVESLNGNFNDAIATAHVPTGYATIPTGTTVRAELVTREVPPLGGGDPVVLSQWEIVTATGEPSSGGSAFFSEYHTVAQTVTATSAKLTGFVALHEGAPGVSYDTLNSDFVFSLGTYAIDISATVSSIAAGDVVATVVPYEASNPLTEYALLTFSPGGTITVPQANTGAIRFVYAAGVDGATVNFRASRDAAAARDAIISKLNIVITEGA